MEQSAFRVAGLAAIVLLGAAASGAAPAEAQTALQQCGQEYQAAKAGGTLNGQTWPQFRSACTARLKAGSAAPPEAAPAAATASPAPANPLKPAPAATSASMSAPEPAAPAAPVATATAPAATAPAKPASAGRAAFVARERQCGTEWKANKASLTTKTPGLTWPKYLSQCNARLKAAGQ